MILPKPQRSERREGAFALTAATTLYADDSAAKAAAALRTALAPATGYQLAAADRDGADIRLTVDPAVGGEEAYALTVSPERVEITGGGPAGVFYGVQSLRQLLPAETFGTAKVERDSWQIPAVEVEDAPRFGWRGTMLDVGRHFMPKEFVLKLIDLLALHKLNVLHFHLTEDQGWRIQIDKYPRLTEVGAWRDGTLVGHLRDYKDRELVFDGKRHGGFYTKDDIREIVAYAADRFVTVVPEIDMPGHMLAAIAAYPELGNGTGPYEVRKHWGIADQVINLDEKTLDFCRDVLSELIELFPSTYIHCGGDECPKKEWKQSAAAQARKAELGLADEDALQAWFTGQMAKFLTEKGRRFVGWDEVLEGGGPANLPNDVVVMSWRSEEGGIEAARGGLDVVMSPTQYCYFDYYQGDPESEPLAIGGNLPLEKVYDYHVVPEELDESAARHVLGTQVNVWTEYIPTPEHAEYMWAPRACAFAEAAWRQRKEDDFDTFVADRLKPHLARLDAIGVNYRPLD
ncbi:MAG TPA: beta-N-acetylhexosaminidase [Actinopolymorphaceae bacterium]